MKDIKNVLYISALASESRVAEVYHHTRTNPGFAVQKFSRLLVRGLIKNGVKATALSSPANTARHGAVVSTVRESENGIDYIYVPFVNIKYVKQVCAFFYIFFYVLIWGFKNNEHKTIICDVLCISSSSAALLASKINRLTSIAVVTDICGLKEVNEKKTLLSRFCTAINSTYSKSFNKYILLTEQMNKLVNPKSRPFIVMEALCDSELISEPSKTIQKTYPRTIIYAGGIFEKYGLKMLADGFIKANVKDAKLVYYGSGTFVDEYKEMCKRNSNLEYRGVAPNEIIVEEERKASVLVNPRFTTEEYTKYSFPSKNMEYMASGTPLLTTKLPGMPKEYYPYVFLFQEETVDGYANAIRKALSHSEFELKSLGYKAKQFVLLNKNNIKQGRRIVMLLNGWIDN